MTSNLAKLSASSKTDSLFILYTFNHKLFSFIMTKETAIGMLRAARNGDQMLEVLNTIAGDFNYIESPMIEQALGLPTLEPIEF